MMLFTLEGTIEQFAAVQNAFTERLAEELFCALASSAALGSQTLLQHTRLLHNVAWDDAAIDFTPGCTLYVSSVRAGSLVLEVVEVLERGKLTTARREALVTGARQLSERPLLQLTRLLNVSVLNVSVAEAAEDVPVRWVEVIPGEPEVESEDSPAAWIVLAIVLLVAYWFWRGKRQAQKRAAAEKTRRNEADRRAEEMTTAHEASLRSAAVAEEEVRRATAAAEEVKAAARGAIVREESWKASFQQEEARRIAAEERLTHSLEQLEQRMENNAANLTAGVLLTYGLEIAENDLIASIDTRFSRVYQSGSDKGRKWLEARAGFGAKQLHWTSPLDRGGHPYHCPPDGWIKIGIRDDDFDEVGRRSWPIVYHGTKQASVTQILRTHLRVGPRAAHGERVYVSPSIIYSSHKTYAAWWDAPDECREVQAVLMCQVNPYKVTKQCNTLGGFKNCDPNHPDETIEWTLKPDLDDGEVSAIDSRSGVRTETKTKN